MKKITAMLLLLSMVLSLFTGCTNEIDNSGYVPTGDAILMEGEEPEDIQEEESTQELTLAYYPDRSLNPLFGSDYTNRVLMSLMYQGLFAVDNQKNVTPILCGRYKISSNRRNLTVYLDPDARFSDGSKVTPQDVVASYWQAKENDYYKNRFRHLIHIEALDDGGILFQLDTSYENFPMLMDIAILKESEVGLNDGIPLGTGPYVFTSGSGGAVLQRNENWWCGSTKIPARDKTINLTEVSNLAEVRDAFQFDGDNSVSVVCANPMSASFAEYRCDYELWEIESGYFLYLACNILYSKHFDDGTLRTFLTYGIDREKLAQEAYNGMVDPVTLPCSPAAEYYSNYLAKNFAYDPLKFISRLASYNIPLENGAPKTMKLLVNSDDSARVEIARTIAADLTEMGLPCTTDEYSTAGYQSQVNNYNFDIYLGMTRLSPTMDLSEFFRPWGEMSWGGLQHETLYDMCKNALDDRGNYYNLYQKLAEDGRIIPLMFGYYNVYAQRGLLPDLQPSRDNVFYYSLGKTMEGCEIEEDTTQ